MSRPNYGAAFKTIWLNKTYNLLFLICETHRTLISNGHLSFISGRYRDKPFLLLR
jgi:hypothetical protein